MFIAIDEDMLNTRGSGSLHAPCPWRIVSWGRSTQQPFYIRLEILSFTACTQKKVPAFYFDRLGDWASYNYLNTLYDCDYYLRVKRPGKHARDRGDWGLANRVCHCALHDLSYDIILPQESSTEVASTKRQKESPRNTQRLEGSGSIREIESSAREAALRRADARFLKVIRGFQAEEMTDSEIADFWSNQPWSCWGQWPKPEGWRRRG